MERWKKCVEFHGHECGGLAIGYKAALYAEKLLEVYDKAIKNKKTKYGNTY